MILIYIVGLIILMCCLLCAFSIGRISGLRSAIKMLEDSKSFINNIKIGSTDD